MKRVTLPLSLCLTALLTLSGCGASGPQCDITVLPNGTNGQSYVATLFWACGGGNSFTDTRRVGFNGRVRVSQRCASSCADIIVTGFHQIFTFSVFPYSIDLLAPPSSVTFSEGDGVDTTYGLPQVAYFDGVGTFIGEAQVTSAGGNWVIANTPDLSEVYTGVYTIQISNRTASGTWEFIGEGIGTAWNRDPPPPPEGGGGGGDDGGGCLSECNAY